MLGRRGTRSMGPVGETRDCEHCGAAFAPRREHARFCSARCRIAWNCQHITDLAAGASALEWSVTAMREVTGQLLLSGAP